MENTHIFYSRRILFRKFDQEDKKKDLDIFDHKNLVYFTDLDISDKNEFLDQVIKAYDEKEDFNFWHMVKLGENESLGMAKVDIEEDTAWVKILTSEKIKNRGYGREALETLIHEIFTENMAKKIKVKAQKDNGPWQEVIKNTQFKEYDQDQDFIYYQITNLDYMKYFAIFGEIDI